MLIYLTIGLTVTAINHFLSDRQRYTDAYEVAKVLMPNHEKWASVVTHLSFFISYSFITVFWFMQLPRVFKLIKLLFNGKEKKTSP